VIGRRKLKLRQKLHDASASPDGAESDYITITFSHSENKAVKANWRCQLQNSVADLLDFVECSEECRLPAVFRKLVVTFAFPKRVLERSLHSRHDDGAIDAVYIGEMKSTIGGGALLLEAGICGSERCWIHAS